MDENDYGSYSTKGKCGNGMDINALPVRLQQHINDGRDVLFFMGAILIFLE